MRHLFADFFAPKTQEYIYDCLEAATKRLLALDETRGSAEYQWHKGEKEVNLVGVRGMRFGHLHTNQSGVFDDTIFVARIVTDTLGKSRKEVWPFEASLDYSTGNAPVLLEGAYAYKFGNHANSGSGHGSLRLGYNSQLSYRALVAAKTNQARDFNQNNIADPFEKVESNVDVQIHIHYGGDGDQVNRNSAGCHVIHNWASYIQFMRLLEQDGSIANSVGRNELEPTSTGLKNRRIIYYLMQGGVYEHFVASQTASPMGERRVKNFGKMDPFSFHDLSTSIENGKNPANFPVSSNGTWHSGVHIPSPNRKAAICATLPGKVIAARLLSPKGESEISNNFVLMHHEVGGLSFFSLYMHVEINAEQFDKIEWLNNRYPCFRAESTIPAYGRNLVLTLRRGMTAAQIKKELDRHKLSNGIEKGAYFWEVPAPKAPNPNPAKTGDVIPGDLVLPVDLQQNSTLESMGYQWVVCEKHPQGCWVLIVDHPGGLPKIDLARPLDSFSDLLAGKITPFCQPVLPGEILAFPGEMMGENGVHFEIFSQTFDIIAQSLSIDQPETGDVSLQGDIPAWVQGAFITELYQGKNHVLSGKSTTFSIKSLSRGSTAQDLGSVQWKIRVFDEAGGILSDKHETGASVKFVVPNERKYDWCEVVAQPYLGLRPDPRLSIHRWILPGEMSILSEFAREHLESKADVKKQTVLNLISSLQLVNPWKKREDDAAIAKRNLLRYSEMATKYQWWDEAINIKTPYLKGYEISNLFYYHPVRFLQALPFLAKGLTGVSQTPSANNQMQYMFNAAHPAANIKINAPCVESDHNRNYTENGQAKRLESKVNSNHGFGGME